MHLKPETSICWHRSVWSKPWISNSHAQIWMLDYKEGWVLKDWCFQTVMLEKTLESPLDCWKFKPVNPKGNQSWLFIGRTDGEAEYFGHLIRRTNSLERTLILRNIEEKRRREEGQQRMRKLDSTINTRNMNLSKLWEIVGNAEVHGVAMSWTWLRDWTIAKIDIYNCKNSTNNKIFNKKK